MALQHANRDFHMAEPVVYLNDRWLPQSQAVVPFHDAGFVYGATATDLCRTFHHESFLLPEHIARFRQSCQAAWIPQPVPDDKLLETARELVARNATLVTADQDLALVLLATPGPVGFYAGAPGGPGDGPPTLLLHTFPLPFARYIGLFREGARLIIPPTRHVPAACVDPRIKQRSRLHWWLAEHQAHAADPMASALLLDRDGFVTETATANFVIVRDGSVSSPPRSTVLNGISLRVVEELCLDLGIPFREMPLRPEDCMTANEAILTNTSYCLAGVRAVNGMELPWPGPLYQRLLRAWSERVGLDIRAQIEKQGQLGKPI
jgi:branched-subunit amino acid aminotransferase/4-amino-4-deoxychorismate lyase